MVDSTIPLYYELGFVENINDKIWSSVCISLSVYIVASHFSMESVDLQMDDLFESGAVEDDYDQAQGTVAELDGEAEEGPMRQGAEDGDNEDGRDDCY